MAAWTYHDWITYAPGSDTRVSRLRSHIQEVSAKIDAEVAADGKSRSSSSLYGYWKDLMAKLEREENHPGQRPGGGMARVRFGRAV